MGFWDADKFIVLLLLKIITSFLLHSPTTDGCLSRIPQNKKPPPPQSNNCTDFDNRFLNQSEKASATLLAQNRMLSVALKYLINDTLQSPNPFEFSCTNSNGTFPDPLDCRSFHVCLNYTKVSTKSCGPELAFDNFTTSCIPEQRVGACNQTYVDSRFECSSTGLHAYPGDCSKFAICTKSHLTIISSCNPGDKFDKGLLLCLPVQEVKCG